MRNATLVLTLVSLLASSLPVLAAETWSGTLVCAFCGLKKPDAKSCQDVLLVKDAAGATTEYYIEKTAVTNGEEACTLEIPATVTGTMTERDGRKWIAPTKIEKKPAK